MFSLILTLPLFFLPLPDDVDRPYIVLASTTSTENSGLFDHLLPRFAAECDIDVRVVAVGTGQALRLAERGDCDVLLVHHRPSEDAFVAAGHGVKRYDVMSNDFVIVGPNNDPAGIGREADAVAAMQRLATTRSTFASRGDDSGTHKKEQELWSAAGLDPQRLESAESGWYRSLGSGMGATLNVANQVDAYTLTDRGTWLGFRNREHLRILVEGDRRLHNPYGVILVNPERHPHVKAAEGKRFIEWLVSDKGREAISSFEVGGERLFHPAEPAAVDSSTGEPHSEPRQEKQSS